MSEDTKHVDGYSILSALHKQIKELENQVLSEQRESAKIRRNYLHEKWEREKAENRCAEAELLPLEPVIELFVSYKQPACASMVLSSYDAGYQSAVVAIEQDVRAMQKELRRIAPEVRSQLKGQAREEAAAANGGSEDESC